MNIIGERLKNLGQQKGVLSKSKKTKEKTSWKIDELTADIG